MTDATPRPSSATSASSRAIDAAQGRALASLGLDLGLAQRISSSAFTPPKPEQLAVHFDGIVPTQLIGRGGMGAVYAATGAEGEQIAIKLLPAQRAGDPDFVDRFVREADALRVLDHPGIVQLIDVGQAGPYLYMLMELVPGQNLRRQLRIEADGRFAQAEAIRLMIAICDALAFAHAQGVIHRDIKPENIIITPSGAPKLLDFGLVKLAENSRLNAFVLTEVNVRMGSPHYMAPEQMMDAAGVDHRADIYSLGVVLYEMLTGSLPAVDYRPPSQRGKVDARLDDIVARCLKEEQSERYASVAELRAALARVAASPHARRNRWVGAAAALAALVGALWFGRVPLGLVELPPPPPGAPIEGVAIAVSPFSPVDARRHQQRWAQHLKLPVEFTNSIGMKFVLIPPGEYLRGRGEAEFDTLLSTEPKPRVDVLRKTDSSVPAHRVRLTHAFYLGVTEVTQGQYASITGQSLGYYRVGNKGEAELDDPDTRQLPVENLAYRYIGECCELLSKAESIDPAAGYRLPTEAQWEFALRGGTTTRFWYGDEMDYAARFELSAWAKPARTAPVASRIANPFGLYDMDGNVSEYCSDWWSPDEFKRLAAREGYPAIDPAGPRDADAPRGGSTRVVRGGNFADLLQSRSSGMRAGNNPHVWYSNVGFRMALPIEGARAIIARGRFEPGPRLDGAPVGAPPGLNGTGMPLALHLLQQAWADYLGLPVHYTNTAGMEFVLVPPGWYNMGCKSDQLEALPPPPPSVLTGEQPVDPYRWARANRERSVTRTIPIYVAVTETTWAQYAAVLPDGAKDAAASPATGPFESGRRPVANITWHDAVAFARVLNDRERIDDVAEGGYRLPTEAEWECIARAGTSLRFPWGDDSESLAGYAHTIRTADAPNLLGAREVAGLQPNAFGLFDTIGNVWEWCSDWASTQLEQPPADGGRLLNPTGPDEAQTDSPPAGRLGVGERIIKGGGYLSPPQELRCAHRSGMAPDGASAEVGFRLVIPARAVAAKLKAHDTPK